MKKKRRVDKATNVQKSFMMCALLIIVGSFIMEILKSFYIISADIEFFEKIIIIAIPGVIGYLFGSNTRINS